MNKNITMTALAVMCTLTLSSMTVSAQIVVDGNMSEWTEDMRVDKAPNTPLVTWHDGEIGVTLLRDNSPANPDNKDFMVDVNYAAIYAYDDAKYLYLRIDMNHRADVRKIFPGTDQYDAVMYPSNGHLTLHMSVDPDITADFKDTTGMSWGWYYNGIDFSTSLFPNDSTFAADNPFGFHVPLRAHLQTGTGSAFSNYQRNPHLGTQIAWNAEYNKVEIAIPRAALNQPDNLPNYTADGHGDFVTFMLAGGAFNTHTGNQWWSQRISNNLSVAGFVYSYTTEWDGADFVAVERPIAIDGNLSDWDEEEMRIDKAPNNPIVTWHDGVIGETLLRDNSPANPDNKDFMVDVNYKALYATDDKDYLYVRVDMNERADVRKVFPSTAQYDAVMYPSNGHLTLHMSVDPDISADFKDTTGMTWGWYYNGIDFSTSLFPNDSTFAADNPHGFQVPLRAHLQTGTGSAFQNYQRNTTIGTKIAWNAEYNKVEIAIPKSALLQPNNLPNYVADGHGSFVTFMLAGGAFNTHTGNQWWSQRISNNLSVAGFVYTYQVEWSGVDIHTTSVDRYATTPSEFTLEQNYPNPFNPTTQIRFTLDSAQPVTVNVYDILGRMVSTMNVGMLSPGTHNMTFDANGLTSGIYLYTVTAGNVTRTGKMVLAK